MVEPTDSKKKAIILLADDDPGDQELTRRALGYSCVKCDLHIVSDGEEALDFLFHRGQYSDAKAFPLPDLFLLDLNMPKLTGRELLKAINEHSRFRRMAIVVLTTSRHRDDILYCYDHGVKSFITKPVDFQEFIDAVRALGDYWFKTVVLPRKVED